MEYKCSACSCRDGSRKVTFRHKIYKVALFTFWFPYTFVLFKHAGTLLRLIIQWMKFFQECLSLQLMEASFHSNFIERLIKIERRSGLRQQNQWSWAIGKIAVCQIYTLKPLRPLLCNTVIMKWKCLSIDMSFSFHQTFVFGFFFFFDISLFPNSFSMKVTDRQMYIHPVGNDFFTELLFFNI